MPILEVRGLTKFIAGQKIIDNLTFAIEKGEVLGFLGPNGAGKTTTVRLITGLYRADEGEILIANLDARRQPLQVKGIFGICTQDFSYNTHYNVEQDLYFYARLQGFSRRQAWIKAREALQWAGLDEYRQKNGTQLSGGLQKRVLLARAMLTNPSLLLLDEPTAGLDLQARRQVWEIILRLREEGKSVFLTTHYMEEAERLCDRVIIINRGRLITAGSAQDLRRRLCLGKVLTLELGDEPVTADIEWLKSQGVPSVITQNSTLEVVLKESMSEITSLLPEILERFRPVTFNLREASLEEIFLAVTGGKKIENIAGS